MPDTISSEFTGPRQALANKPSAWRETQGGWTIALGPGASANIQLTKRGEVRWTLLLSGSAETIAEAQARLEEIAGRIGSANE